MNLSSLAISASNISYRIGSKIILDDINLDLRCGEVTTLLGPNGAGKSTLLKLLCDEIASFNDIRYFGKAKDQWDCNELATRLGVLPQHSTLFCF